MARLDGHQLVWHKVGKDGSAKCDIVEDLSNSAAVWGVLYEIDPNQRSSLDQVEGLGVGYDEKQVEVDCSGELYGCLTYQAIQTDDSIWPFGWYKALVVAGARQNSLPPSYVSLLQTAETVADPDERRRARNLSLIGPRPE